MDTTRKRVSLKRRRFMPFLSLMLCIALIMGSAGNAFAEAGGEDKPQNEAFPATEQEAVAASKEQKGAPLSHKGSVQAQSENNQQSVLAENLATEDEDAELQAPVASGTSQISGTEEAANSENAAKSEVAEQSSLPADETRTLTVDAKDGAKVTVRGELPEGSYIEAVPVYTQKIEDVLRQEVGGDEQELVEYAAYDITIYNVDGEEIQPEGNVRVTIDSPAIAEDSDTGDIGVCYVDEEAVTAQVLPAEGATFETDHFSIYAVYTTRYGNMKVTFHVNEGPDANTNAPITKTIYSSYPSYQYKIGRDVPTSPRPPEGYTFVGWSTSETERKLFDLHRTPITESIDLYAWFETGVVKVGTELELRSAVGYSTAPLTIELTDDINLTDPLAEVPDASSDIYPAMDPYSQYPAYRQALYITPGQDITLTGTYSIAATVTTSKKYTVTNGNVVSVYGKLTLDGPTITQIGTDGVIYGIATGRSGNYPKDTPTPTVIFKSGNICGVYLGIAVSNGHLEMEGGNIYNNGNGSIKSIGDGGGVSVSGSGAYGASANISGGNIYNNTANRGGGVSLSAGGKNASLTISGGNIYDNHAAIYYPNGYAYGGHGGGIFVSGGAYASLTIAGGNIYNNEADKYGGGVYSDVYATLPLAISDGKIYENKAQYGGGIFTYADLNISGGAIYENSAAYGGGIYCDDYYSARNGIVRALNISGTASIRDNVAAAPDAASYGGGIFAETAVAMDMTGGEISGNVASYGGGIYTESYNNLSIGESVEFSSNTAKKLTSLNESDEEFAIYKANIKVPDGKWSVAGVKYGYNNYDINYLGTELLAVNFDTNGGSFADGSVTGTVLAEKDVALGSRMPSTPSRSGYTFRSWNTAANNSGTVFTEATVVTEAITVYAVWESVNVPNPPTPPTPPGVVPLPLPTVDSADPVPPAPQTSSDPVALTPRTTTGAVTPDEPDEQIVEEDEVPLADEEPAGHWAFLNLILAILGTVGGLVFTLMHFLRRSKNEARETHGAEGGDHATKETEPQARRKVFAVLSLVLGLISLLVFFLTENMSLRMAFTDQWTLLMVTLALLELAMAVISCLKTAKKESSYGEEIPALG